ncbi:MAG TPA: hypothetical protein VGO15_07300 [Candidatus Limnocylindrales bacterium]|jgi:hypothetical protein|nr:hypothetical protein [Candidatus Limnocylindrales bacterium]
MDEEERQGPVDRPLRRVCLVAGCTCQDARIISTRRAAFYASQARKHGETADRAIAPDPDWQTLFSPLRVFGPLVARSGPLDP